MADLMRIVRASTLSGHVRRPLVWIRSRSEFKRAVTNASWLLSEHAVRWIAALVVGVLVARYLGPAFYGEFKLAGAIIGLLAPVCALGLSSILSKEVLISPERQDEVLGTAFILRLGACLLAVPIALGIVAGLDIGGPFMLLFVAILALGNMFNALRVIDFWFEAQVQSRYVVIARSTAVIVIAGVKLMLLLLEAPLVAFVIASATEGVLVGLGAIVAYRYRGQRIWHWRFRLGTARRLLRRSWPLILSSFTAVIYLKVDQIMLGSMVSIEAVGIYAVAAGLSELWYVIPQALAASVYPNLLRSREMSPTTYRAKLQKTYDGLILLAIMIAVPLALLSTPLIVFLYGEAYRQAGPILAIHIWASVFIFMRALLSKWLIIEDLYIFSLMLHGCGAVLNVVLNLLLIPSLGGIGAAVATVISYAGASYFALFAHPRTRDAARMMTKAFSAPYRALRSLV